MTTELAVIKQNAKISKRQQGHEVIMELLRNPAITTILGCTLVEILQHIRIGDPGIRPEQPGGETGHGIWTPFGIWWFDPVKPPQAAQLMSDQLGSAIEIGLIVNLAGGLGNVIDQISKLGETIGLLGLTKGLIK